MTGLVRLVWAAAFAAIVLVAGCAAPVASGDAGAGRDLVTASDETDADRRARTRLALASAYFARGQSETALDEVKQAIAARPDLGPAFNLRGLIYASLGEQALADESFRRAIQINPRDADALHNFAWFHCQSNRFDEGQVLFEQALAVPQYRGVARTLMAQGLCQARAGRWSDAERSLLRSYELDASSPVTAANLADVLYRRGEYERARFYVRRVNVQREVSNAQTLWLAARIEHKLGNRAGVQGFGQELRERFPQSREAIAYDQGRFDD